MTFCRISKVLKTKWLESVCNLSQSPNRTSLSPPRYFIVVWSNLARRRIFRPRVGIVGGVFCIDGGLGRTEIKIEQKFELKNLGKINKVQIRVPEHTED